MAGPPRRNIGRSRCGLVFCPGWCPKLRRDSGKQRGYLRPAAVAKADDGCFYIVVPLAEAGNRDVAKDDVEETSTLKRKVDGRAHQLGLGCCSAKLRKGDCHAVPHRP